MSSVKFIIIGALTAAFFYAALTGMGNDHDVHYPQQQWSFTAPFGTFDRAAAQRGFQVYKEVCSSCHAMKFMSYRNLMQLGFSEAEVKAIAAQYTVKDGPNDEGEMFERPALPSDRFASPYANEQAARAANAGAYPPDLSVITKARKDGPNYIYNLLTGYEQPPANMTMGDGMHYNKWFKGGQIAMAQPLYEGGVTYADGTAATPEQMAKDVVTFLHFAAEPNLERRHQMGLSVIIFLVVMTALLYGINRAIWSRVKK